MVRTGEYRPSCSRIRRRLSENFHDTYEFFPTEPWAKPTARPWAESLATDALEGGIGRRAAEAPVSGGSNEHQFFCVLYRELTKEHRLKEADDRRVGSDADGESHDDNSRETGTVANAPDFVGSVIASRPRIAGIGDRVVGARARR